MADKAQIARGVLIALCSSALGFGTSQIMVGREVTDKLADINVAVTRNMKDIENMKERDLRHENELLQLRQQTDSRIKNVVDSIALLINQNSDLVQMLKVQNELLRERQKARP